MARNNAQSLAILRNCSPFCFVRVVSCPGPGAVHLLAWLHKLCPPASQAARQPASEPTTDVTADNVASNGFLRDARVSVVPVPSPSPSPLSVGVMMPGCLSVCLYVCLTVSAPVSAACSLCYFVWAIGSEMPDPVSHSHCPSPYPTLPLQLPQSLCLCICSSSIASAKFCGPTCPPLPKKKKPVSFTQLLHWLFGLLSS